MAITIDSIKRDIAAFALSGLHPSVTAGTHPDTFELCWTSRRGHPRVALLEQRGSVWIVRLGSAEMPYLQYLASEDVADLEVLARRTMARVQSTADYLDVEVAIETESNNDSIESDKDHGRGVVKLIDCLNRASSHSDATRVFFLRGAAGAGKSAMLREVSRALAGQWLDGNRTGPLALYIDAQAKALLSLDDAFSSVLDDLDVLSIRKEAVVVLCKHGLVVPCIDGFDELLGAGGFGDAFNSLSGFISRLGGAGTIVASGRSTFYDQEQLQVTANRYTDADYRTTTITVHPWSAEMIREFCSSKWAHRPDTARLLVNLGRLLKSATISQLLGKPFFSAQLAREMPFADFSESKSIVDQLVEELLEREARKWVDLNKEQVLTSAQHRNLLKDVALEMWWENSQEINVESLKVLVEFFAQDLPLDHRPIVIGKAPTHGMFESGMPGVHHHAKLRFQHPIYLDFFICEKMIESVERSDAASLLALMNRGVFGEAMLDILEQSSATWDNKRISVFLERISACLRSDGRYHPARLNAGAIAAVLLSHRASIEGVVLKHFLFQRVSIVWSCIRGGHFDSCAFEDVAMHGLVLEACSFSNCTLRRARIGTSTRFACDILSGCEVISLLDDDGDGFTAAPDKIAEILRQHGAPRPSAPLRQLSKVQQERRSVLDRLLRKLARQYYFGQELETLWGLHGQSEWANLKQVMLRTGVAAHRNVERGGPNGTLITLNFTPSQIRDGESGAAATPQAIRDLWTYIG